MADLARDATESAKAASGRALEKVLPHRSHPKPFWSGRSTAAEEVTMVGRSVRARARVAPGLVRRARRAVAPLALALALFAPAPAGATPIFVAFDIKITLSPDPPPQFDPFDFTDGVVSFLQSAAPACDPGGDNCVVFPPANVCGFNVPTLTAGGVFAPVDPCVPPDPIIPTELLMLTITGVSGGTHLAYGFPGGTLQPEGPPVTPVSLGTFGVDAIVGSQLMVSGPIFAFSSAEQIGTWEATATVINPVAEPATLLLVGAGGVGLFARMRRRGKRRD